MGLANGSATPKASPSPVPVAVPVLVPVAVKPPSPPPTAVQYVQKVVASSPPPPPPSSVVKVVVAPSPPPPPPKSESFTLLYSANNPCLHALLCTVSQAHAEENSVVQCLSRSLLASPKTPPTLVKELDWCLDWCPCRDINIDSCALRPLHEHQQLPAELRNRSPWSSWSSSCMLTIGLCSGS